MEIADRRIFITGGAGFIGTVLIRCLVDDNKIVVCDSLHRDAISNSGLLQHKNVEFVRGDVLDFGKLKRAISGSQIVIHLAAVAGVDSVMQDMVGTLRVNVIGTYNVLEAAKTLPDLERFVDFSTGEVSLTDVSHRGITTVKIGSDILAWASLIG